MVSDWELSTLEDADVILIDCVHKTPPDAGEGYPYIAIPQIKNGCIDFSLNPRLISHSDYKKWTIKANPQADDIVLSRRCNPGETAYVPKGVEFALGQNLVLLRSIGEKVYPPYLRWLVRGPEWWAQVSKYLNVGAVFDSLRCGEIPKFELLIPPLPEQKAIAHILGSLDDKIELNRQMNATLEAMAQALFKSWFVDFDPVIDNALAAGNSIPDELFERAEQRKEVEKKDQSDINTLFPDEFELTEGMGWIPKGWEVTRFTELAVLDTASVKPNSEPEKIWEHFSIPSFDINATPAFDTGESIKSNKYKVNANAILVSKLNPETERIWWVNIQDADSAVCSTEFMQFIPKNFNHRAFIYSLLRSEYFRAEILSRVTGSTGSHQRTQPKSVAVIDVLKPNDGLVSKFSQIALDWKIRVSENIEQDAILAKLRDILLPKLMSGELRIPDAEALADEAI